MRGFFCCLCACVCFSSCSSDSTSSAATCATSGTASVTLGLSGITGSLSVDLMRSGAKLVSATTGIAVSIPAGPVQIARIRIPSADPIARSVNLSPAMDFCANGTTSATLTFAPVATSNKLWVGNATGGSGPILGFSSGSLGSSGTPAASIVASTSGSGGFAFDKDGNFWTVGGTTSDAAISRYSAASFGSSGSKQADVILQNSVMSGGSPGVVALAFDSSGNLWSSVKYAGKVLKIDSARLVSGTVSESVTLSGISAASGLAFDKSGNLFVGSEDGIAGFSASSLGSSVSAPERVIKAQSAGAVTSSLGGAISLAFDKDGNLWAGFDGSIARFTASEIATSGTVTPGVIWGSDVAALPVGIAFDESGGLWTASNAGKFIRIDKSGKVDRTISSADIGYAQWFGVYPAPSGLPLFHSL